MHRSRKSIVTLAAALAGVLGMAGVAAAAHGTSKSPGETVHHRRGRAATTTTASGAATTTTKVEHGQPEPGDDNGQDAAGDDANEHAAAAASSAVGRAHAEVGDDNGRDLANHDANDDNRGDATTTTVGGTTTTTGSTTTSMAGATTTTTTVATIPNGMQTFTVSGGAVTVDIENGVISLASATPSAGFVVDKSESRSDRVEVEFRGGDVQSRVRVRLDNGRLRVEVGDH